MDVKARFWWVTILVQNPFWVKMVKYLIIHLEGKRYEGHFKASPPVSLCDGVWNLKMWWENILPSDSTKNHIFIFIISFCLLSSSPVSTFNAASNSAFSSASRPSRSSSASCLSRAASLESAIKVGWWAFKLGGSGKICSNISDSQVRIDLTSALFSWTWSGWYKTEHGIPKLQEKFCYNKQRFVD